MCKKSFYYDYRIYSRISRIEFLEPYILYLLVYCYLLKTDPPISRIEKIIYKICPKFLDLYASIYGILS